MIKALFKMLRITTVYCLLAAEHVLICRDYLGSIADGSQRRLCAKNSLYQVKHDHKAANLKTCY